MDRVKCLKIETAADGTQSDPFPVEVNPTQDYLATKGISFENFISKYLDLDASGNIKFNDTVETDMPLWKLRRAIHEIFDPTGSILTSTNSEAAIKELALYVSAASRAFILEYYGGNANAGRILNMFNGISMDEAPLEVVNELKFVSIVSRTTAVDATCQIGWYDIQSGAPVLLHTTTFTAVKKVFESGTFSAPIFTLPPGGQLMTKVITGSILKPHIYFSGIGG